MNKQELLKIGFAIRMVVFFLLIVFTIYFLTNCVPAKKYRLLESDYQKAGEELRVLRQQNKFNSEYIRLDTIKKGGSDE